LLGRQQAKDPLGCCTFLLCNTALSLPVAWIGASPASISTMSCKSSSLATCRASTSLACSDRTKANIARCHECSAEFSRRVRLISGDCRITDFSRSSSDRKASCLRMGSNASVIPRGTLLVRKAGKWP
jgi:hypothetical protein